MPVTLFVYALQILDTIHGVSPAAGSGGRRRKNRVFQTHLKSIRPANPRPRAHDLAEDIGATPASDLARRRTPFANGWRGHVVSGCVITARPAFVIQRVSVARHSGVHNSSRVSKDVTAEGEASGGEAHGVGFRHGRRDENTLRHRIDHVRTLRSLVSIAAHLPSVRRSAVHRDISLNLRRTMKAKRPNDLVTASLVLPLGGLQHPGPWVESDIVSDSDAGLVP